jgi:hypothetical protein
VLYDWFQGTGRLFPRQNLRPADDPLTHDAAVQRTQGGQLSHLAQPRQPKGFVTQSASHVGQSGKLLGRGKRLREAQVRLQQTSDEVFLGSECDNVGRTRLTWPAGHEPESGGQKEGSNQGGAGNRAPGA